MSRLSGANNVPLGARSEGGGSLKAAASTLGGMSLLNPAYLGDDAPQPSASEKINELSQSIILGPIDPWSNGELESQGTLKRTRYIDEDYENNNKKRKLDIDQGLKRTAEEKVAGTIFQDCLNLEKGANGIKKRLLKMSKCQTCNILIAYRDSKTFETHIQNCVKYSKWLIIQDQYQCKICQEKMTVWTSAFDHVEKMHYNPQLEMEKKAAALRRLSYAKIQIQHIIDNVHTDIIDKMDAEEQSSEIPLAISELGKVLEIQLKRLKLIARPIETVVKKKT